MSATRVGAVGYLNAQPLVYELDRWPELVTVRFDPPATCAALLRDGLIDLGLIPSIEYAREPDYRVVPGLAIASEGAVASVALFTPRPLGSIRSIAVDISSRTSVALLRVLCAEWFHIRPVLVTRSPDLPVMLDECDAALTIGDAALFTDYRAAGLQKIDLGEQWTAMTGLPFVWAFWAGRSDILAGHEVTMLQAARDRGLTAIDDIAAAYCGPDAEKVAIGRAYLRENIRYELGERECAGLQAFYGLARQHQLVPSSKLVRFYAPATRSAHAVSHDER